MKSLEMGCFGGRKMVVKPSLEGGFVLPLVKKNGFWIFLFFLWNKN